MFGKRASVISLITIGLGLGAVAVASADGGSGASSVVIAAGESEGSFNVPQSAEHDVVIVQNSFDPGGFSGWHSHPGYTVVVVQSGQITLYRERVGGGACRVHTYHAGQVFVEWPRDEQNGVNRGSTPTVVGVTFFNVPHGGSTRIERTAPANCPA